MIRVLLIEDHTMFRAGVRALLRDTPDIDVVGEASTGEEGLQLLQQLKPDIAIMDITMPGINGLAVADQAMKQQPGIRIIFLTMHHTEEYVRQALLIGAAGFVVKESSAEELELAIRSAFVGDTYLSPVISKQVVADYVRSGEDAAGNERLTPRQRDILRLIAEGCSTQEMGQRLNISVKTVESHRAQLMERLGIWDVPGLVRYAVRHGIVSE